MNLLQYLNTLYFKLLIVCIGTKTYSQREIHPLEPMFSYDYALKYYSNIPIKSFLHDVYGMTYCYLENFKAPKQVSRIEMYHDIHTDVEIFEYRGSAEIEADKRSYIYDKKTGLLTQSLLTRFSDDRLKEDTLRIDNYFYKIENNLIKILQITANTENSYQYVFETATGNLTQLINNDRDTLYFTYHKDIKNQVISIQDEKFVNPVQYEKYIKNNLGKIPEFVKRDSLNQHSISDDYILYVGYVLNQSKTDDLYRITLKVSNNSIYHSRKGKDYKEKTGTISFDTNMNMTEYHIKSIPKINFKQTSLGSFKSQKKAVEKNGWFYSGYNISLKRQNKRKWAVFYNYDPAKTNRDSDEILVKKRKARYTTDRESIYINQKPIIDFCYK